MFIILYSSIIGRYFKNSARFTMMHIFDNSCVNVFLTCDISAFVYMVTYVVLTATMKIFN